jgi:hypothetical protein
MNYWYRILGDQAAYSILWNEWRISQKDQHWVGKTDFYPFSQMSMKNKCLVYIIIMYFDLISQDTLIKIILSVQIQTLNLYLTPSAF